MTVMHHGHHHTGREHLERTSPLFDHHAGLMKLELVLVS